MLQIGFSRAQTCTASCVPDSRPQSYQLPTTGMGIWLNAFIPYGRHTDRQKRYTSLVWGIIYDFFEMVHTIRVCGALRLVRFK